MFRKKFSNKGNNRRVRNRENRLYIKIGMLQLLRIYNKYIILLQART